MGVPPRLAGSLESTVKLRLALAIPGALLAAASQAAAPSIPGTLLGDPIPAESTPSIVVVGSATRYVTVDHGDAVRFIVDGKAFGFRFDGAEHARVIDLQAIAPPGLVQRSIPVYVQGDRSLSPP